MDAATFQALYRGLMVIRQGFEYVLRRACCLDKFSSTLPLPIYLLGEEGFITFSPQQLKTVRIMMRTPKYMVIQLIWRNEKDYFSVMVISFSSRIT